MSTRFTAAVGCGLGSSGSLTTGLRPLTPSGLIIKVIMISTIDKLLFPVFSLFSTLV